MIFSQELLHIFLAHATQSDSVALGERLLKEEGTVDQLVERVLERTGGFDSGRNAAQEHTPDSQKLCTGNRFCWSPPAGPCLGQVRFFLHFLNLHCKFHTLFEDAFIEECEILRADSLENDLDVLGEFATEETMRDQWGWSEILDLKC